MEWVSPCCNRPIREDRDGEIRYQCSVCPGFGAGLATLRRNSEEEEFNRFWQGIRAAAHSGKTCPSCRERMPEFKLGSITLDACEICQLVWFDAEEWHPVEKVKEPQEPRELTVEEQRAIIEMRHGSIVRAMNGVDQPPPFGPMASSRYIGDDIVITEFALRVLLTALRLSL